MKKLKYDACDLHSELENHKVFHKDLVAVGSIMIFLQSDKGVFKDSDFSKALPFMKKTAVKRLLNRLDGKILQIIQSNEDSRIRVIKWSIDWSQFVYEVEE